MNVYDAMARIWWHEPDAFISVHVNTKMICVLSQDDEPHISLIERLKSLECPSMLYRQEIPGFMKHIIISIKEEEECS